MTGALAHLLIDALERSPVPVASTVGERLDPRAGLDVAAGIARALRGRDIEPDEPVLVGIANRPGDLAALLGIWLAGAVAVPVHVAASAMTLTAIARATAVRFRVDGDMVSALGTTPPPRRILLGDAAFVIFTSGSTGQPKGVVIGHARFAAKLAALGRLVVLRPQDVVIVPLQLTFIFGLWVSILTLSASAHLLLVPKFSAGPVTQALEGGASIIAAVPSMLRALVSGPSIVAPSLRAVLTGGEALGGPLARALRDVLKGAGIFDLYGLTETGSCDFCLGPADQRLGCGTIGAPTEGVTYRVMAQDALAEPGTPGELQIRTPFSMLGYLDDPVLTESSFSDGYFRTGDLARSNAAGHVELVGRIKEIISRGGNKIAPAELDNLLCGHPDVAAALCAGVPDARLGETIHALVVPRPGAAITPEALREWVTARTERYKVPDVIHFGDSVPLGATGKADRRAVARGMREPSAS